jgi:GrpB-like predicted nucleotidyltransferase (UPF0157 family)
MPIEVTPYNPDWPRTFERIAATLRPAFAHIPSAAIEHVGSTAVPGLAAKPIIDIDIIVEPTDIPAGIAALKSLGYRHRGDLGVPGREAFYSPDDDPRRHVYLCERGCLSVRNHLAVRDLLRRRPDLRDQYGAIKLALATDPTIDIDAYLARKSPILQVILTEVGFTPTELAQILGINTTPSQPPSS